MPGRFPFKVRVWCFALSGHVLFRARYSSPPAPGFNSG